jgi:hypothetical protein
MQKFNEFLNNKNLVEAIVDSEADVDALCNGILGLAQQGRLTEEMIVEAWYGEKLNEFWGGVPQAGRVAAGIGGGAARAAGDAAGLAGRGLGWLGKKVMGGARSAAGALGNVAKAGANAVGNVAGAGMNAANQAAGALGGAANQAAGALGGAAKAGANVLGGAANAVGGYAKDKYQDAVKAQAQKQVKDRMDALYGDLAALGLDKNAVQQALAPLTQILQQQQQPPAGGNPAAGSASAVM